MSETARLAYRLDEITVEAAVTVPVLATAVAGLFPDYRCAPQADALPSLTLTREGPGDFVVADGRDGWREASAADALARFEYRLAERLARGGSRPVVHAGGAILGGGAVLFPGPSGSGKSSLTAGLAAKGVAVLGDDAVFMDPDSLEVHPFRRLLKVHREAREALGLPDPDPVLAPFWSEAALYHPRSLGGDFGGPARLSAVVFPERRRGASLRTDELSPTQTVRRLLGDVLLVARPGAMEFDLLTRAVEDARGYTVRFHRAAEAVDAVLTILEGE